MKSGRSQFPFRSIPFVAPVALFGVVVVACLFTSSMALAGPADGTPESRAQFRLGLLAGLTDNQAILHSNPTTGTFGSYHAGSAETLRNKQYEHPPTGPTLGLELGAQWPQWAVYLSGQVSSILFMNQAAASVRVEMTPVRRWSMATGLGIDGIYTIASAWAGIAIPLGVSYHFAPRAPRGWQVDLEGSFGLDPRGWTDWGVRESLLFGYVWR